MGTADPMYLPSDMTLTVQCIHHTKLHNVISTQSIYYSMEYV